MNTQIKKLIGFEYKIVYTYGENERGEREGFNKVVFSKEEFKEYLADSEGIKNIKIIGFNFVECIKYITSEGNIFNNEEDALIYEEKRTKLKEDNRIFKENQDKMEENKKRLLDKKEKYLNLFLKTIKNKMNRGGAKKVLYKMANYTHQNKSDGMNERFIFMEQFNKKGFKPAYEEEIYFDKEYKELRRWKYRVYSGDSFWNIRKIEYNYLNFLQDYNKLEDNI